MTPRRHVEGIREQQQFSSERRKSHSSYSKIIVHRQRISTGVSECDLASLPTHIIGHFWDEFCRRHSSSNSVKAVKDKMLCCDIRAQSIRRYIAVAYTSNMPAVSHVHGMTSVSPHA